MKHSERHTTIHVSQYATNNLIEITKPSASAATSATHSCLKNSVLNALGSKGMLPFLKCNLRHSIDNAGISSTKKQRTKLMLFSKGTLPHIYTKNAICITGYKLSTPAKKK
jgi:hypothetical protein